MGKFIIPAFSLLLLSPSVKAATIDPAPKVTVLRYGGQISSDTVTHNPYGFEGVLYKDVKQAGMTSYSTSSSFSSVDISLSSAPRLSSISEAGVKANGSSEGQSGAFLDYYFEILGPKTASIPVLVQAKGETKVEGPQANADAKFTLLGPGTTEISQSIASSTDPHGTIGNQSFKIDQYYNLISNTEYLAIISVDTFAGNGPFSGRSLSSAMIDPFFMIDPAYSDYSLVFSSGINNTLVSQVPLPGSLPLFGAAFLIVGFAGYGRAYVRRPAAA